MKKNLVKMAAVAAVAMIAQVAGAQSFPGRMKAEVPFAFQAGKATLMPGTYEVTMLWTNSGSGTLMIAGTDPYRAVHLSIPPSFRKEVKDGTAAFEFACGSPPCVLRSVRVLNTEYGTGAKAKMTPMERERLYTIRLTPTQGRSAE